MQFHFTRRKEDNDECEYIYEIEVEIPEEDRDADARVKIDLLTTVFLSEVENTEWKVVIADYDAGCIKALIKSSRFKNIRSGRVMVKLSRRDGWEDI